METTAVQLKQRRGYVLLTTLLLLLLVAAALASACRVSLRQALAADEAERELQDRWAAISSEQTLLPVCETILRNETTQSHNPIASCRQTVQLNGRDVIFVIGDEQAKLNVPSLMQRLGKVDSEIALRTFLSGSGMTKKIKLRPHITDASLATSNGPGIGEQDAAPTSQPSVVHLAPTQTIENFGSVFDAIGPQELLQSGHGAAPVAEMVTCWGDGKLNWLRASEHVLRLALSPPLDLTQVAKLMSLRKSSPPVSLSEALNSLGLDGPQRNAASNRLSDGSACHSLWVLQSSTGRTDYKFYVQDQSNAPPVQMSYEW